MIVPDICELKSIENGLQRASCHIQQIDTLQWSLQLSNRSPWTALATVSGSWLTVAVRLADKLNHESLGRWLRFNAELPPTTKIGFDPVKRQPHLLTHIRFHLQDDPESLIATRTRTIKAAELMCLKKSNARLRTSARNSAKPPPQRRLKASQRFAEIAEGFGLETEVRQGVVHINRPNVNAAPLGLKVRNTNQDSSIISLEVPLDGSPAESCCDAARSHLLLVANFSFRFGRAIESTNGDRATVCWEAAVPPLPDEIQLNEAIAALVAARDLTTAELSALNNVVTANVYLHMQGLST